MLKKGRGTQGVDGRFMIFETVRLTILLSSVLEDFGLRKLVVCSCVSRVLYLGGAMLCWL